MVDSKATGDPDCEGHDAWPEMHAADGPQTTALYTSAFAGTKSTGTDIGPLDVYQFFGIGGRDLGAFMTEAQFPRPAWLIYFRVERIDPEGIMFALIGKR